MNSFSAQFACLCRQFVRRGLRTLVVLGLILSFAGQSAYAASPEAATFLKLLQSGKLPPENVGTVLELICGKGDADDLRIVFEKILDPKALTADARAKALASLSVAWEDRQLKPAGDLAGLASLLASDQPEVLRAAVRLCGLWKLTSVSKDLQSLATSPKSPEPLRTAALAALVKLGGNDSRAAIEKLCAKGLPAALRVQAAAALASFDSSAAAGPAAEVLADLTAADSPAPLIEAFLSAKGGQEKLASAVEKHPPAKEVALLAMRAMYSFGRNDEPLSGVLGKIADIPVQVAKPTPDLIAQYVKESVEKGDAVRGEAVFRRGDVGCLKCHSLIRAGGQVGPDLSPLGATSPVEYVVTSILDPNAAIKEQYLTKTVETTDGQALTGIVVESSEQRLKLKDATGKEIVIPRANIDTERVGRTLMPDGLTKFLTHQEVLDLVRFVSELGKPGPFGPRTTPTIQRWRVVRSLPAELGDGSDAEKIRTFALDSKPEAWSSAYSRVDGHLPLCEIVPKAGAAAVVLLQGEIDITEAGPVTFKLKAPAGTTSWLDGSPNDDKTEFTTDVPLDTGRHKLLLRVPSTGDVKETVLVEVSPPENATTRLDVVGGQ